MKKINLAIIGHGFVGKAVDFGFNRYVNKYRIDPTLNTTIGHLKNISLDVIFICVPTPMNKDGSINIDIIKSCFNELAKNNINYNLIVIKSTVTPHLTEQLCKDNVIYNPEFLRENTANEDFIHPKFHVFGGTNQYYLDKLKDLYHDHSSCKPCPIHYMLPAEASFVKYGINSFLASKVLWFNQLYNMIEYTGYNYTSIVNAITNDSRIGTSHTSVPGHDGKRFFGGACFPKDTAAFLEYSRSISQEFTVLKEIIRVNNEGRSQYDLDEREASQNINFDN
jgi:UDPglucose 6-dehydrogenase